MATTTELAERLAHGWQVCERAPPDRRLDYDNHWISLLRQWEAAWIREHKEWQQSASPADSPQTQNYDTPPMEQLSLN